MRSKLQPYIFLYSQLNNSFESTIEKAEADVIESMRLRARFNTHRNVNFYGLLATDLQVKSLNKQLDENLVNDTDISIFESIKNKVTNLGF